MQWQIHVTMNAEFMSENASSPGSYCNGLIEKCVRLYDVLEIQNWFQVIQVLAENRHTQF